MDTYIIIACAAQARIFYRTGANELAELEVLVRADRRGHHSATTIRGRGGTAQRESHNPPTSIEPRAAATFVSELAGYLHQVCTEAGPVSLILIAEPRFLSQLRAQLDAGTTARVIETIDMDLSRESAAALRRLLAHSRESIRGITGLALNQRQAN